MLTLNPAKRISPTEIIAFLEESMSNGVWYFLLCLIKNINIITPYQRTSIKILPLFSIISCEYDYSTFLRTWLSKFSRCCIFPPIFLTPQLLFSLHKPTTSHLNLSPNSHRLKELAFFLLVIRLTNYFE